MEIKKLNTLRALATLIVFITHFSDVTNWFSGSLGGGAGAYGVMLFFLLSGFLMSYLYLNKPCTASNIIGYLTARAGRVLPLYFIIVIASFAFTQFGTSALYNIGTSTELIGHLLFMYGESVLWTIAPEIHFYTMFVALWVLASYRAGYLYMLMIAVMILLYFTNFPRIYGDVNGIPFNLFNTIRSLPYFFVGMMFGALYGKLVIPNYMKKHTFILMLALIPLMYPAFSPVNTLDVKRMWLSYEVLFVMSSIFFCIVFLVPNNNVFLVNRIGDFVGKISYSLYLFHLPIIMFVNTLGFSIAITFVVSLSASILLAFLSYRYFERPIATWLRKLQSQPKITP